MEREPEFFLNLILHHGGKFLRDDKNVLEYVGGEIDVWEGLDVDTMCLWTPSDLCKEHGYVRFDSIWWHNPDFNLEKGLRPLAEDLDVRQMCNIGMVRDWEMHIYFEHPIDTPKISQKAPNDATIDEDLRRTVDDILRMTMAPHFVEDDASEDTEVVQLIADQSNVEETENEFGDGGIEVEGSAEEGTECDGAAGADLIDTNAEDIADFEGAVGADNIDTNAEKITEFDGAAGVDNTVAEDEELNDVEGAAGAGMGEDDRGKGSSEEDITYEASEESFGDDYESASDSLYRPSTLQCDDEDEEDSAVPRRKKKVGENVGSSSRQRRQVGGSGSDGSGGSMDGGVGENMAAGEEDAAAGEEHVADGEEANSDEEGSRADIIVAPVAGGDPPTEGAAAPAASAEPQANDHQATEINLSQSTPLYMEFRTLKLNQLSMTYQATMQQPKLLMTCKMCRLLPPQTVVRPPPVRPSGLVMPTASRIPGVGLLRRSMPTFNPLTRTSSATSSVSLRAPIHTIPPPIAPPASRPGSPPSMPPPTRGVSKDTFQAPSRGVQQRFMKFMPTPGLQQNPPSNQ
ncbi:hypothetical protein SESBI_29893 [Sesbania bispinosa]|nr:hypothetical protein SESBI_29893 [Sesbania bispinosa]